MTALFSSPGTLPDQRDSVVARLRGATKRFATVVALDSLDLENRRGKFLALLGPNGVDKTTAIDLLLGLRVPSAPRPIAASLAWLAGYGLLFFAVAAWAFRREEGRAFV